MKLWIIDKEGIILSQIIAEILQDRLEDYIDVLVGFSNMIDPAFLVEEPFWVEFLQNNINAEMIYPPILSLKLKCADFSLVDGVLEIVKDYSNDFIEFLIQ